MPRKLSSVGGERGRAQVDDGAGLADFDRLFSACDGEVGRERREAAHFNRHACDVQAGKAGMRDPRVVVARRQAEKAEIALGVGA